MVTMITLVLWQMFKKHSYLGGFFPKFPRLFLMIFFCGGIFPQQISIIMDFDEPTTLEDSTP